MSHEDKFYPIRHDEGEEGHEQTQEVRIARIARGLGSAALKLLALGYTADTAQTAGEGEIEASSLQKLATLADRFFDGVLATSYWAGGERLSQRLSYDLVSDPDILRYYPLIEWGMDQDGRPFYTKVELQSRCRPPDNFGELRLGKYHKPVEAHADIGPLYRLAVTEADDEGRPTDIIEEYWFSEDHGILVKKQSDRSAHDSLLEDYARLSSYDPWRQGLEVMKATGYVDDPATRIQMWLSAGDPIRGIPSEEEWPGLWRPDT